MLPSAALPLTAGRESSTTRTAQAIRAHRAPAVVRGAGARCPLGNPRPQRLRRRRRGDPHHLGRGLGRGAGGPRRLAGPPPGRRTTAGPAPAPPRPLALPPLAIMVEVFLTVLAVDSTDYWASPFAFCLLSVVVAAGFAQGFGLGLRVAGVVDPQRRHPRPPASWPTSASRASASAASGASSWCWWPSWPATPAASSARPSSATRRPSTGCRSWPRPTTCSSPSTGWPRACPPRSTSTRWPRPPSSACGASSTATSPPSCSATT